MSLINGFEDVVGHIKKQEQRIKELEEDNTWLTEQCKENFDELHKWMGLMHQYREKWGKLQEENKKLCNFLGGNFDSEEDVKKILKDHYSEEFIKTNTERWREVGIDFEEKEEYVPTGSKVDMEQFQKLMESGMVPWASKKSGEEE